MPRFPMHRNSCLAGRNETSSSPDNIQELRKLQSNFWKIFGFFGGERFCGHWKRRGRAGIVGPKSFMESVLWRIYSTESLPFGSTNPRLTFALATPYLFWFQLGQSFVTNTFHIKFCLSLLAPGFWSLADSFLRCYGFFGL